MMIFKKVKDPTNPFDTSSVTIESSALTIPDILEDFKSFLMACGYPVDFTDSIVIEKEEAEEEE